MRNYVVRANVEGQWRPGLVKRTFAPRQRGEEETFIGDDSESEVDGIEYAPHVPDKYVQRAEIFVNGEVRSTNVFEFLVSTKPDRVSGSAVTNESYAWVFPRNGEVPENAIGCGLQGRPDQKLQMVAACRIGQDPGQVTMSQVQKLDHRSRQLVAGDLDESCEVLVAEKVLPGLSESVLEQLAGEYRAPNGDTFMLRPVPDGKFFWNNKELLKPELQRGVLADVNDGRDHYWIHYRNGDVLGLWNRKSKTSADFFERIGPYREKYVMHPDSIAGFYKCSQTWAGNESVVGKIGQIVRVGVYDYRWHFAGKTRTFRDNRSEGGHNLFRGTLGSTTDNDALQFDPESETDVPTFFNQLGDVLEFKRIEDSPTDETPAVQRPEDMKIYPEQDSNRPMKTLRLSVGPMKLAHILAHFRQIPNDTAATANC